MVLFNFPGGDCPKAAAPHIVYIGPVISAVGLAESDKKWYDKFRFGGRGRCPFVQDARGDYHE